MSDVLFCLDSASARHPGLIGLGDERLETLPWVQVCCSARSSRELARDGAGSKEVWVASCDDMDAINLAAAIKNDSADKNVVLVCDQLTGSTMSKARMAGVEVVLDSASFARHYAKIKRAYAAEQMRLTGQKTALSITVTGASGGVGKSSVAALVAALAARSGKRTLLIDADLQFGDAASSLKGALRLSASDVLADVDQLAEAPDEESLVVVVPPARLEQAESLSCELPTLLDVASTLFDVVVVDTGHIWDDTMLALIERSAKTLFVVGQRASSVRAAKRALDLIMRCGVATGPVQFVLNRCSKTAPFSSLDLSCALQGAAVYELKDGGSEVEELLGIGLAESLAAERNPFAESVAALVADLLPAVQDGAPALLAKKGSILGKLKGSGPSSRSARRRDAQ